MRYDPKENIGLLSLSSSPEIAVLGVPFRDPGFGMVCPSGEGSGECNYGILSPGSLDKENSGDSYLSGHRPVHSPFQFPGWSGISTIRFWHSSCCRLNNQPHTSSWVHLLQSSGWNTGRHQGVSGRRGGTRRRLPGDPGRESQNYENKVFWSELIWQGDWAKANYRKSATLS